MVKADFVVKSTTKFLWNPLLKPNDTPYPQFSWSWEHKGRASKGGQVLDVLDDNHLDLHHLHHHHHPLLLGMHPKWLHHQQLHWLNPLHLLIWALSHTTGILPCSSLLFCSFCNKSFDWYMQNQFLMKQREKKNRGETSQPSLSLFSFHHKN